MLRLLTLESTGARDSTPWLAYWVIYALLGLVEYIAYDFLQALVLYNLAKTIFLIWLMAPCTANGSSILYNKFIRSLVLKYKPAASQPVPDSDSYTTGYSSTSGYN